MPIHPGMVEPLAERTRDLYAGAEERLLGIVARQLAAGLDAPGWAERKLAAIQQLRRASQGVVDELGKAVTLEVFDAVAEAYNEGHRAAVAEIGALSDNARALVDDVTPNAQSVDRLAQETVDLVTSTHRSILRAVVDRFRAIVAEVTATPLLGTGTRRQATQDAMRRFADEGIRSFVDRAGRRWQLTSYAEMAVRTSVARAATEAHTRTLSDAGIDLVYVSDAPRECPLCRPWEGRVLAIDGPTGERTVEVEHAIEDGRMIPVRVAGTLDEARLAGFQHPNCRHSVSAYTPGLTTIEQAESDPDGYEQGQRQRAIERNIRKHKKREAAAVTPEAQRAARLKVRQWQGAMRDHLAAHPGLRRNPKREQPGASNLPPEQRPRRPGAPKPPGPPTPEQVDAARVWSGDDQAVREMSDDQLAAAMRSNLLDDRARARIEAEADRRDLDDLLGRIAPGGTLADDLTGFGDQELARAFPHLDDGDALRVMAEMDRRDLAGRLPGVSPDLVGLSDHDLAARARGADPDTLALIAAEAARRDLLGRLFPGGQLLGDLSDVSDDELAWCMSYATSEELLRIAAEMDRRDAVDMPQPANTGDAVEDLLADRNALADALDPAPNPDGWGALADDAVWAAAVGDDQAATGGDDHDDEPRITRRQAREMYDEYVYMQFLKAEHDCNGYLLNKRGREAGWSPQSLFSGPARVAYANASDELKEWWADNGRMTQAEFVEQATGKPQRWAAAARFNESKEQQRR
ncbi:MuF-like minor capsid protein [Streptomyces phage Darolandstone]|uniref:MuF-like minor capsid protein n=1 Tax=Streptomyces phage Darolandstone TaxID=2315716 RepID=A0A386KLG2_9CAUD|nr:head morphogenesis [Streptomyces phage Darolandstone]AYD86196.1 MuF-like minor capsid protein [Streptomyces phage Darolandstone]